MIEYDRIRALLSRTMNMMNCVGNTSSTLTMLSSYTIIRFIITHMPIGFQKAVASIFLTSVEKVTHMIKQLKVDQFHCNRICI